MSEVDQVRARTEMQDLYYTSRPSMWCFRFCKCVLSDLFGIFPQSACRMLRPRTRLQPLTRKRQIQSPSQSPRPAVAPMLIGPTVVQRLRSVTGTVADSQISKNNYRNELHPSLVARIAQLSNTMAQHGQHRPQGPYPNDSGILSLAQIQQWAHQNPTLVPCLSTCSEGLQTESPFGPAQRCVPTPHSRNFYYRLARSLKGAFAPHLRGFLRTLAPFGPIHYVCCSFHLLCIFLLSIIHTFP
jgi:hypothetical protein